MTPSVLRSSSSFCSNTAAADVAAAAVFDGDMDDNAVEGLWSLRGAYRVLGFKQ